MSKIQNHPAVFWFLAFVAIASFVFAIYTYQVTKPSREVSYITYRRDLGENGILGLPVRINTLSGEISTEGGYLHEVHVWNSGNMEVERSHVLRPLSISVPDSTYFVSVEARNMNLGQLEYKLDGRTLSFELEKVFPKSGFIVRLLSPDREPKLTINGLVHDPIMGAHSITYSRLDAFGFFDGARKENTYKYVLFAVVGLLGVLSIPKALSVAKRDRIGLFTGTLLIINSIGLLVLTSWTLWNGIVAASPF